MAKRAVCVGINDYPGSYNDLRGCVNDANDWASLLREEFGFGDNVNVVTDAAAAKANILSSLRDMVGMAKGEDVIVFTYSGHGTWVPDQGELDEFDNRDEAICAYDGNVLDDELRGIIRGLGPDVHLTVISDSCFSGGVTRAMLMRAYERDREAAEHAPKPRYMPPEDTIQAARGMMLPFRRRLLYPDSDMSEVLLTGCNSTQYSYDAYIDGRFNGAMTAMAIQVIKSDPQQTYRAFYRQLRQILPSGNYPQNPQLEGSRENKDRPLFT
ncbi:MAG: caspase family protein [Planctomycetota bacterium]|jgi:hypothetical protein